MFIPLFAIVATLKGMSNPYQTTDDRRKRYIISFNRNCKLTSKNLEGDKSFRTSQLQSCETLSVVQRITTQVNYTETVAYNLYAFLNPPLWV